MVHDLGAWERTEPSTFPIGKDFISITSPWNMAVLEVRSHTDLDIFRKVYGNSTLIGEQQAQWSIEYARELNMVDDSKLFPPLDRWRERGFAPDQFGRWVGPKGEKALPLYEGRMIGQFDPEQKGWVSGKGRSAIWRDIPADNKQFEPACLILEHDYRGYPRAFLKPKVMFMDIGSATNTRTFFGCVVPNLPSGHVVPTLRVDDGDLIPSLVVSALCNSFVFDYVLRTRMSGLHVSWFILEECPLPREIDQNTFDRLASCSARLSLIHRRFAPEWLRLKSSFSDLATGEWKTLWAVTEADRLRMRIEIDALCADLYGLDPDDFDWIARDDTTDPKGFYRVDRQLPLRERLTGLAATAFRALKEGKWSAETAASLSNDEFFDLLGIPELTSAQTAHAKGLPDPLIAKRDGCHVWTPESFPEEDPRHGWTWDDCWNDAVALLGGEEAVRDYIEGTAQAPADPNRAARSSRRSSSAAQPRLFD